MKKKKNDVKYNNSRNRDGQLKNPVREQERLKHVAAKSLAMS